MKLLRSFSLAAVLTMTVWQWLSCQAEQSILLIPVGLLIMYFVSRKQHKKTEGKVDIPYFLFFFILVAVVNNFITLPASLSTVIDQLTTLLMVMAMVGLGLSVPLQSIREKALKPLYALVITSVLYL